MDKELFNDPRYDVFDVELPLPPHYLRSPSFTFGDGFTLKPSSCIELRDAEYGRGVFATENLPKGTLVEESPAVYAHKGVQEDSVMIAYLFDGPLPDRPIVCLGYGSLFNHSDVPNIVWQSNIENTTMRFYAYRDIERGEELCISYDQVGYQNLDRIKSNEQRTSP